MWSNWIIQTDGNSIAIAFLYVLLFFLVVSLPDCDFSMIQIQGTLINVLCKLLILMKHYASEKIRDVSR